MEKINNVVWITIVILISSCQIDSNLTSDNNLKDEISERKAIFNDYTEKNNLNLLTCPVCGFPTIEKQVNYEFCEVCGWDAFGYIDLDSNKIVLNRTTELEIKKLQDIFSDKLQNVADSLEGVVIDNPDKIMKVLEDYNQKWQQLYKSEAGDSILIRMEELREIILEDLIEH